MSDKVKLRVDLTSKEDVVNKVTSLSSNSTNSQYPSAKAVYDALQNVDSGEGVDDFYIDTTTDEIVIVTGGGNGSGGSSITVDSSWVANSTNPVQSQLIKSALDGKADSSHTHSNYVNPTIADNLTTNDSSQVLSARQGKLLDEKIGNILTIINGSGN